MVWSLNGRFRNIIIFCCCCFPASLRNAPFCSALKVICCLFVCMTTSLLLLSINLLNLRDVVCLSVCLSACICYGLLSWLFSVVINKCCSNNVGWSVRSPGCPSVSTYWIMLLLLRLYKTNWLTTPSKSVTLTIHFWKGSTKWVIMRLRIIEICMLGFVPSLQPCATWMSTIYIC